MKISKETWCQFKLHYGDFEARRRLGWTTKRAKHIADSNVQHCRRRDPHSLIMDLIHIWPNGDPAQNRLKFAVIIREVLRQSRMHRERIASLCAPGVSRRRLP